MFPSGSSPLLPLLLTIVLCAILAVPSLAVSSYGPVCSSFAVPKGWQRWSKKSTWPNRKVPGVDGKKGIVIIPCNTGIILDRSITVDQLIINGWLQVKDKGPFQVKANFVIVQGKLTIGKEKHPYNGKITFTLTKSNYNFSWVRPDGKGTVGTKAFAVIGGSVEMNGMPKNLNTWTRLVKTANKGAKSITVPKSVSKWPVGSIIAIASTDYDYRQAESRTIAYSKLVNGKTVLGFNEPLKYNHWGAPISAGNGKLIYESAEVAMLTRNIVIQGSSDSDSLFGGHFIVFETPVQQKITGVELINMGQQGFLGRYPLHFHMCRTVRGSYVKKLSIHNTNQRCVVVHGSFGVTVEHNVAFRTKGHCYFLEDGIESGNVFNGNLGFYTEKAIRVIKSAESNATQSDDVPSTFWLSNPNNTITNNVAAGSEDSGFWFQLAPTVLGPSLKLPEAKGVFPMFVPSKEFSGNWGHSNQRSGARTFAEGMKPREKGGRYNGAGAQYAKPVTVTFQNFKAYKNAGNGLLIRHTDSIIVDGGVFADNRVGGIEIHDAQNIVIRNSLFLGETVNIGNPTGCDQKNNPYVNCEPLPGYGCSLPVDPSHARSLGSGQSIKKAPMYGILIDKMEFPSEGLTIYQYQSRGPPYPILIHSNTFGMFSNRCKASAAIGADGFRQWHIFSAGHRSHSLKFLDSSPRFYISPQELGIQGNYAFRNSGPTAKSVVFRDLDGSLVGGTHGYVVANTKALLPGSPKACTGVVGGSYAWLCPGTCYRTLQFQAANYLAPFFTVARPSDGAKYSFQGYYQSTFINLLAGSKYDISFTPPYPLYLDMTYADPNSCTSSLTFNILFPKGYFYKFQYVNKKDCQQAKKGGAPCKITTSVVCGKGSAKSKINIVMGGKTWSTVRIVLVKGTHPSC